MDSGLLVQIIKIKNRLDALHKDLSDKQLTVGEIMTMPSGRVFNFADNEGNYFAIKE